MVSVFAIVKVYEIELKAAYSHISNSAEGKRAGTSADGNPVPAKVAKPSKPAYMEDKRLYKCLEKDMTEDQVQRTERQKTKWGRFKASRFMVPCIVCVTDNLLIIRRDRVFNTIFESLLTLHAVYLALNYICKMCRGRSRAIKYHIEKIRKSKEEGKF